MEFSLKTDIMTGREKNEVDAHWKGNGAQENEGDIDYLPILQFQVDNLLKNNEL